MLKHDPFNILLVDMAVVFIFPVGAVCLVLSVSAVYFYTCFVVSK